LFPFALSISSGYIPLITQFYYLSEGLDSSESENKGLATDFDPKRVQYTHMLTWLWVIVISMMLLEIILLSFFAPLEIWSLFTNFINYFILLLFMIFEWLFRNFYFKQWESPLIFIRQLIVIDHRQLLKKHP
jgi:magnesium-transporting ATPase (P-type)